MNLKHQLKGSHYRMSEQFSEAIMRERRKFQPLIESTIQNKQRFSLKYNKLVTEGVTYFYDESSDTVKPLNPTPTGEYQMGSQHSDVGMVTDCSGEGMVTSNEPEYQNAKLNSSFELGNISVLSWDVGKLRRNEKNHDFKNFCSVFEIVCLQETWGRSEGDFTDLLLNYQSFVSIRSSDKHCSGGVAIYVKDEIAQGCNRILNEVKDAVFLKLDKQFFGWENDIVLGSIYLSPEGSVIYTEGKSGTEILENYILKLLNSCTDYHLLLVGDFNSRTGNMDDFILRDDADLIPELSENPTYQTDNFQAPRSNSDTEINNYGKHLISICKSYGLHFLHGRFSGDRHGSTNCTANKGFSVVDYMIADSAFFEFVKDFSVIKRDESDHFPLACVIKTPIASHHQLEDEIISDLHPRRFKFDSSTEEDFEERVSDHFSEQKCKNILKRLSRSTFKSSSLNSIICKINDLFCIGERV